MSLRLRVLVAAKLDGEIPKSHLRMSACHNQVVLGQRVLRGLDQWPHSFL